MKTPALLFSAAALTNIVSRLKQMGEHTGWSWAATLTDMVPLALLQNVIVPATVTASCSTISDAEYLADAGFKKIVLTGRLVDAASLRRLLNIAARTRVVAVIDHFRHAELLSQAVLQTGSVVEILVEADLGNQSTGVCPGPDASLLATAASRLPGLRVTGVFADAVCRNTPAKPSDRTLDIASIVTIAEHCLRSVQHIGPDCRDVVLAASARWNSSLQDSRATCLVASPFVNFSDDACETIDERGHERPSVCLMATVIARPSLEWCVIDAGRIAFGESSVLRITAPQGATVLHSTADSTTLTLLGESRDLRIGDTVRLVMNAPDQLLVQRRNSVFDDVSAFSDPQSG